VHETTENPCVDGSIPPRTTIKMEMKPFIGFFYLPKNGSRDMDIL